MKDRWHSLGNVSSRKLEDLWKEMAATFSRAPNETAAGSAKWRVLQPPTGTGKTQGLCVYSALAIDRNWASLDPLGILIVTRTIAQAKEIEATIKDLIKDPRHAERVKASHSEARLHPFAMHSADVLVITHEAYTRALEGLCKEQHGRWEDFKTWEHGPRRLTIIDEALSGIVEENQIRADQVRMVLGFIDQPLRSQFPTQVAGLEWACEILDKIGSSDKLGAHIVWRNGAHECLQPPMAGGMQTLREAMKGIRYDLLALQKDSPYDRQRIADIVGRTLKHCEAIMARWAYYYRKGKGDTFNSSQLLIPPGLSGPVILDATASQNFLWKLLEKRAEIATIPSGTRIYANATIHVARGSGLGKTKMSEKGKERIPRILADLERRLTTDRKVLVCVHKKIEHIAMSYKPKFACSVAHWGAIDGKNDWNDHDAVVICGLPYREPIWATNMFFALQGLQDDHWLDKPSWGAYEDVRREMQRRQIAVSVIQAMNRVRCRRVIDGEGNCPSADIFIILPRGTEGDAILSYLREEMPGINVCSWDLEVDGPSQRVRRGSSHEALVSLMSNRNPGETYMSFIQSELGLTCSAKKELQNVLRDDEHDLTRSLAHLGVRYMTTGKGRGARSYLVKR